MQAETEAKKAEKAKQEAVKQCEQRIHEIEIQFKETEQLLKS